MEAQAPDIDTLIPDHQLGQIYETEWRGHTWAVIYLPLTHPYGCDPMCAVPICQVVGETPSSPHEVLLRAVAWGNCGGGYMKASHCQTVDDPTSPDQDQTSQLRIGLADAASFLDILFCAIEAGNTLEFRARGPERQAILSALEQAIADYNAKEDIDRQEGRLT